MQMSSHSQSSVTSKEESFFSSPVYGLAKGSSEPAQEVYPRILLGSQKAGANHVWLKHRRISHVLVVHQSLEPSYKRIKCEVVRLNDSPFTLALEAWKQGIRFLEKALKEHGRILVHCAKGISRSAALLVAFLMYKEDMSYDDAFARINEVRSIYPNLGFQRQLKELESRLRCAVNDGLGGKELLEVFTDPPQSINEVYISVEVRGDSGVRTLRG
eukprot:GHVU01035549.1.p1 GENE.GHVU01035549.1~~GHVU01035549.1.p1  ORF type:complete len:215 (+),score=19.17 GHVU01035549.1:51-695(+)